jgi:hypothetical protein
MNWLLIIAGVTATGTNTETTWRDYNSVQACKQAAIVAERTAPTKGVTITGMSCVGHSSANTFDFHFNTDGRWSVPSAMGDNQ